MGFHDIVFLPTRASFSTTFLKYCSRGESLRTTTCPKTVIWGKQWHARSKIPLLQQGLFSVCRIHEDHKAVIRMRLI